MSDSDLSLVQRFLKRCHMQHFISYPLSPKPIRSLFFYFQKSITINGHPLSRIIPERKETNYKLHKIGCLFPKINTERFKTTFANTVFIRLTALGAYSRWALIKFATFSVSVVCVFCNKTINGNEKTRRCNKARFL